MNNDGRTATRRIGLVVPIGPCVVGIRTREYFPLFVKEYVNGIEHKQLYVLTQHRYIDSPVAVASLLLFGVKVRGWVRLKEELALSEKMTKVIHQEKIISILFV